MTPLCRGSFPPTLPWHVRQMTRIRAHSFHMVVGPPQDSARLPCCRTGSAGPSGASGECGGHGQATGCGLHDRSAPTPAGKTTCWSLPGGSLLWETGLLVSLPPPGRKLCPPTRDVGPLGQWRLRVPVGLWLEIALVGSSRAVVEMSSAPFPLPGFRRLPHREFGARRRTELQPVARGQKPHTPQSVATSGTGPWRYSVPSLAFSRLSAVTREARGPKRVERSACIVSLVSQSELVRR